MYYSKTARGRLRQKYIDAAKGIGILLIVIGHMLYDSSHELLNKMIYGFHVPMFFIISGFLFCEYSVKHDVICTVDKKIHRLLLPYLAFTLLALDRICEESKIKGIRAVLKLIIYLDGKIFFNAPLWFLVVMFEVFLVEILISERINHLYLLLILIVGGYFLSQHTEVKALNYFGFNRTVICLIFFEIGLLLKTVHDKCGHHIYSFVLGKKCQNKLTVCISTAIILCVLGYVYLMACINNYKVSIYSMILGNYFLFIIAGICGSLFIIGICKVFFDSENIIGKLSKYSILILGSQYFFIDPFCEMMRMKNLDKTGIYDVTMIGVAAFIVLIIPFVYRCVINKIPIVKALNGEW